MLNGKTILITGSSRGIGAAIARLAKHRGATVILHGKTESEELRRLAADLDSSYLVFDIIDEAAVQNKIKQSAPIDILVNNAGISISKPFLELTHKEWMHVLGTNVMGTVNVSRAVIPGMLNRGSGKIINIASIKGLPQTSGRAAFAASKAAIIALTASMAKEFKTSILVNCVAPGFTETETTKEAWGERIFKQIAQAPLARAGKPNEIAEAVLFLASENASYITGQTLIVDGGYSIAA